MMMAHIRQRTTFVCVIEMFAAFGCFSART
jgi:hypothetical protein